MRPKRALFRAAAAISRVVNAGLRPLGFRLSRRTPPLRTTSDMVRALFQDKTEAYVIDVGAAAGNFSAEVIQAVPRAKIVCVEPVPECHKTLTARFAKSDVSLVQAALGDHDGEVIFHETSGRDSSSVLPMERHREEFPLVSWEVATYPVKLLRLDTLLAGDPETLAIDLLKIDAQGYELPVLVGAERTLRRCRFVLVETAFMPLYLGQAPFEDVVVFLHQRGFRVSDYVEVIRSNRTSDLLQMDFLYQRNQDIAGS